MYWNTQKAAVPSNDHNISPPATPFSSFCLSSAFLFKITTQVSFVELCKVKEHMETKSVFHNNSAIWILALRVHSFKQENSGKKAHEQNLRTSQKEVFIQGWTFYFKFNKFHFQRIANSHKFVTNHQIGDPFFPAHNARSRHSIPHCLLKWFPFSYCSFSSV